LKGLTDFTAQAPIRVAALSLGACLPLAFADGSLTCWTDSEGMARESPKKIGATFPPFSAV
jgi:hypothetical protein